MTAFIITVSVIAGLVAYVATGVFARRYTMPRAINRAYENERRDSYLAGRNEAYCRARALDDFDVKTVHGLTVWAWPFVVPYYALSRRGRTVESYAPWAAEERAIKAEQRIVELERELGIGGGPR